MPLSIEDCCTRLQAHDQRRATRHPRLKEPIKVALESLDAETIAFRAYNPLNTLIFGRPNTRAYGTFNRQADGSTLVLVNAGTTRFGYLCYWIFWLGLWVLYTVAVLPKSLTGDALVLPLLSAPLLVWIVWYGVRALPRQHCELLNTVLVALGRMRKNRRDLSDC